MPCIAYPRLTGPVAVGDDVVVNTQARDLGLGSGGFDVLHVNLTRGLGLAAQPGAHVMKLPYTSLQAAEPHVEEHGELAGSLDGMPVVLCTLHSQVAPVCAGLGGLRVAYVQIPGGALPVSLSDAIRTLKRVGLVERTVGVGRVLRCGRGVRNGGRGSGLGVGRGRRRCSLQRGAGHHRHGDTARARGTCAGRGGECRDRARGKSCSRSARLAGGGSGTSPAGLAPRGRCPRAHARPGGCRLAARARRPVPGGRVGRRRRGRLGGGLCGRAPR